MADKIILTDETIRTLKSRHGENLLRFDIERGGQTIVVRGPNPDEFQKAIDKSSEGGRQRSDATMELGEACVVFPDAETCQRIADSMPGLYFTAGGKALELSGVTDGYNVKKL